MTKNMLIIEPSGHCEYRDVPTGYPALNDAVLDGGFAQAMRCITPDGDMVVFLMDEEGKFKNLTPNLIATMLWYKLGGAQLMPGDIFSGRVTICGTKGDEFDDVPESAVAIVKDGL